jgi:hypothetical protein
MKRINRFNLSFFLMFILCFCAFAQENNPANAVNRGDYLTVKLAVIGPGYPIYFWWGHLGLIIEDTLTGENTFYDYGVFTFDSDSFIENFAFGRLWYATTASPESAVINSYKKENRSIIIYTLNLSSEQKLELLNLTKNDLLPQNRIYLYNHFKDNCVTRITNNLNTVLNGEFYKKADETPGRFTLRGHVRRHTGAHPFWDWLLNFLMGQVIDKPITARAEMFLPSETGLFAENFYYTDETGSEQKLVSATDAVYTASGRPFVLDRPWNNIPGAAVIGLLIAGFFLWTMILEKKHTLLARRLFGSANAFLGLILGTAGGALFFMTFFTDHDYTYENCNVIFANPLLLTAFPLGLAAAFGKNIKRVKIYTNIIRILWTYVFLAALLTVVIKIFPAYYQDNWAVLAVFLPVSLVLSKFIRLR